MATRKRKIPVQETAHDVDNDVMAHYYRVKWVGLNQYDREIVISRFEQAHIDTFGCFPIPALISGAKA